MKQANEIQSAEKVVNRKHQQAGIYHMLMRVTHGIKEHKQKKKPKPVKVV